MKMRLLCLGLFAAITQLFASGCCCCHHPVARWRANHPCGVCHPCASYHPLLHPVQTRRTILGESGGGSTPVTSNGAVAINPPCHGCEGSGASVGLNGGPGGLVPVTHPPTTGYPPIGYPKPLTNGPTVVPSYELPAPMPVPKNNGQ